MALLLWAAGALSGPRAALGAKLSPVCPLRHHQPAPALGAEGDSLRTGVGSILGLTRGEGGFLKLELELPTRTTSSLVLFVPCPPSQTFDTSEDRFSAET